MTRHPADDRSPDLSYDGGSVVFTSYRDDNAEIYASSASGGNETNLTRDPAEDTDPALLPGRVPVPGGGPAFAFTRTRLSEKGDIWVKRGLLRPTNLTNSPEPESAPAYSPTGQQVAFSSDPTNPDEGWRPEIFVMNADGSKKTNITNDPEAWDHNASWGGGLVEEVPAPGPPPTG